MENVKKVTKTTKKAAPKKRRSVSYRPELVEQNIVLSVRHLKQFFKFGHGRNSFKTKAVHDVSFDIYGGECFGLVGESGCGKTTTGRSLIRLYKITSGSVYFKGYRISAGKRWNEKEIKWTVIRCKKKIKDLKQQEKDEIERKKDITGLRAIIRDIDAQIATLKEKISKLKIEYKDALRVVTQVDDEDEAEALKEKAEREYQTNLQPAELEINKLKAKRRQVLEEVKNKEKTAVVEDPVKLQKEIDEIHASYQKQIDEITAHMKSVVKEQKKIIKQINYDNNHVDKKLLTKMQMIFQDPVDSLDPRMTVEDIIQEGLRIQGHTNRYKNSKKVKEMLETVGLIPEYASRYPHEFSGGQRQRIGIARALVMNPEFLICDEPISALDVSIRAQIINLLNDMKQKYGLTMLFIAHDLSVVKYFCDRIAVMYYGEIVELATSDELFKHPLHPYTNALLSAIPKPDPISERTRKRIIYNPLKDHDYSKERPKLVEIVPGHYVLANSEELTRYKEKIAKIDNSK